MKKLTILILSLVIALTSCTKFLDVQPTGTLLDAQQFQDIQGYYDALYGVYGSMASPRLYGKELSYGFADKIGAQFANLNISSVDNFIYKYDYKNQDVVSIIDNIWLNQYQTISYINNILGHLEQPAFSHSDLPMIKGELLALRAFLHFDIVRLFTNNFKLEPDSKGIPYAYTFDIKNKQLFTLRESYANIIKDLKNAEELLKEDTFVEIEEETSDGYRNGRAAHMNLFAVKATLARVYYTMGNAEEAARYAREVINSKNFALTTASNFTKVMRFPYNNIKGKELIFGLHNRNIGREVLNQFYSEQFIERNFTQGRKDLKELYELNSASATSTDVRYSNFYIDVNNGNLFRFIRLVKDEEQLKKSPLQGLELITLPEMYYILIESIYDSNKDEALNLLNKFRLSRGLSAIDINNSKFNTKENLEIELMKDKMREFPGMGLTFYALKYYNRDFTDFNNVKVSASKEIFVLPWPENELEYGNR